MPRNSVFNGILHKNFISLLNLAHFKLTKHCQGISTLKTNQPCHFNDPSFHFKLSKSHSISKPIISFRYSLVIQIIILTVTNYSIILLSKVIQTYHSIQISFNFQRNSKAIPSKSTMVLIVRNVAKTIVSKGTLKSARRRREKKSRMSFSEIGVFDKLVRQGWVGGWGVPWRFSDLHPTCKKFQ